MGSRRSKEALLAALRAAPDGLTVVQAARATGLHAATVSDHLHELTGAKLVERSVLNMPGSPRMFRLVGLARKKIAMVPGPGQRREECRNYAGRGGCLDRFCRESTARDAHCPDGCIGYVEIVARAEDFNGRKG